jgi:glycine cleavage system transcriptional repressor
VKKVVISGVGPDKPGIVSGLTEVLYRHQCNIEDSSMTILGQSFAMILIVTLPDEVTVDLLWEEFKTVEDKLDISLFIQPLSESEARRTRIGSPYLLSIAGHDRTGITYHVSKLLAQHGVNVTDLNAHRMDGDDGPVYIMLVEVEIPDSVRVENVEADLKDLEQELQVETGLRPLEGIAL